MQREHLEELRRARHELEPLNLLKTYLLESTAALGDGVQTITARLNDFSEFWSTVSILTLLVLDFCRIINFILLDLC